MRTPLEFNPVWSQSRLNHWHEDDYMPCDSKDSTGIQSLESQKSTPFRQLKKFYGEQPKIDRFGRRQSELIKLEFLALKRQINGAVDKPLLCFALSAQFSHSIQSLAFTSDFNQQLQSELQPELHPAASPATSLPWPTSIKPIELIRSSWWALPPVELRFSPRISLSLFGFRHMNGCSHSVD